MFTYDPLERFTSEKENCPCASDETECVKPCDPMKPLAPHKPHHSLPEMVHHTSRELRDTLQRLKLFEETLTAKYDGLMSIMTQDNVTFKNLMTDAWKDFTSAVKSEINLFESNIESVIALFREGIFKRLEEYEKEHEQDYSTFRANVNARITAFEGEIRAAYDEAVRFMKTNLSESVENVVQEMVDNDQIVGILDTTVHVNVRQHFAMGDGVTDDTNAFKDAIAECNSTGKPLFVPAGTYLITEPLEITKTITIEGANESESVLLVNSNIAIFTVPKNSDSSDEWNIRDTKFKNLTFKNERSQTGIGIQFGHNDMDKLYNVPFVVIDNCRFESLMWGIILEGYGHMISNSYVGHCMNGIAFTHPEQTTVINTWVEYCVTGVRINTLKQHYGHNFQWYGGAIQRNTFGMIAHNFYELFVNTYCENNDYNDICLGDSTDRTNYTKGVKNAKIILNSAKGGTSNLYYPVEVNASVNVEVHIARYEPTDVPFVYVSDYSKFVNVYCIVDGGIPESVTQYIRCAGDAVKSTWLFINNVVVRSPKTDAIAKYTAGINGTPIREDKVDFFANANRYIEKYNDSGKVIMMSNTSHSKLIIVNEETGGEILSVANNPTADYKVVNFNIPVVVSGGLKIGDKVYSIWCEDGVVKAVEK